MVVDLSYFRFSSSVNHQFDICNKTKKTKAIVTFSTCSIAISELLIQTSGDNSII